MNLQGHKHIVNLLNIRPFPSNSALEEYSYCRSWKVVILDVISGSERVH